MLSIEALLIATEVAYRVTLPILSHSVCSEIVHYIFGLLVRSVHPFVRSETAKVKCLYSRSSDMPSSQPDYLRDLISVQ